MFSYFFNNKKVRELRKKQGLTARELAMIVKVDSPVIKRIDDYRFKNVPEPLKSRIEPALRGRRVRS